MHHGDLGSTGEPVAMDTGGLLGFFLASGSSAPVGIKCGGSIVAWIVRTLEGCCWAMKDARILGLQRRGIQPRASNEVKEGMILLL